MYALGVTWSETQLSKERGTEFEYVRTIQVNKKLLLYKISKDTKYILILRIDNSIIKLGSKEESE